MKQEYKISMKLFAFVMAILMLLVSLPVAAYANIVNTEMDETSIDAEIKADKQDVIVLEEDEALRDENIKHFKLSDGTTKAVVYSQAVHYKDGDGKWIDIDNALTLNGSEYSSNNKQTVKFANKSGSNGLVSIKDGYYKIDFTPLNTNKVKVEIENPQGNNSRKFEDMSVLNNLVSKATYADIYDGIDIEYILVGNNIKENIIVKEKQDSYTFSFELKLNKLSAELKDGAIILSDYDSGEQVYEIPAPYMLDANNIYSNSVEYSLVQDSKWKYTFTVTADAEWINAEERAFPVTIDPTIGAETYAMETLTVKKDDVASPSSNTIRVGNNYISYLKQNELPVLPNDAYIINASVNLVISGGGFAGEYIGVNRVNNDWNEMLTWEDVENHIAGDFTTNYISGNYISGSVNVYTWDITEIVNLWYNGTANYGIAFKSINGKNENFVSFYNEENEHSNRPRMVLTYRDMKGIESYFPLISQSAGIGGTGYVNLATGQLTYSIDTLTTTESIFGITPAMIYNSALAGERYQYDNAQVGYKKTYESMGFKFSLHETLIRNYYTDANDVGREYYIWTDGDGTEHYFFESQKEGEENIFYDEDGLQLKLVVNIAADGSNSSNNPYCKIIDADFNERVFVLFENALTNETMGTWYLDSFVDKSGNKLRIEKDGSKRPNDIKLTPYGTTDTIQLFGPIYNSDGIITLIWCNSSKEGILFRHSDTPRGELNPTGGRYLREMIHLTCSLNKSWRDAKNFLSETDNEAEGITVNSLIKYEYSEDGQLCRIENTFTGQTLVYSYYTNGKVAAVIEYDVNENIGQRLEITYSNEQTEVRNSGSDDVIGNEDDLINVYVFDNQGRAVTSYTTNLNGDKIYGATVGQYVSDNDNAKNSIKTSSIIGTTSSNYLINGDFEYTDNSKAYWASSSNVSDVTRNDDYDQTSTKALKLDLSTQNSAYIFQYVYLNEGKYTLSLDAYAIDAENVNFVMNVYDGIDIVKTEKIPVFKETGEHTDYLVSFDFSVECIGYKNIKVEIRAETNGECGSIHIDNVMLSKLVGVSEYNCVTHGNFEKSPISPETGGAVAVNVGDFWYYETINDANEIVKVPLTDSNTQSAYIEYYNSEFENALRIDGNITTTQEIMQKIFLSNDYNVEKNKALTLTVSGFGFSQNAMSGNISQFGLQLYYEYLDENGTAQLKYEYFPFNPSVDKWQLAVGTVTIPNNIKLKNMWVECIYSHNLGEAYFDNITVTKSLTNTTVEYDYYADGKIKYQKQGTDEAFYHYENGLLVDSFVNNVRTKYTYDTYNRVKEEEMYVFVSDLSVKDYEAIKTNATTSHLTTKTKYVYDNNPEYDETLLGPGLLTSTEYINMKNANATDADREKIVTTNTYYTGSNCKIYGALKSSTDSLGKTTRYFVNENNGRLIALIEPDNTGLYYTYDGAGRLVMVQPATYQGTTYSAVTDSTNVVYTYNSKNQLESINANGTLYTFTYDDFGNQKGISIGESTLVDQTKNAHNGKVTSNTYSNGTIVLYEYDELERVSKITYQNENDTVEYTYEYDARGNLHKITDSLNNTVTSYKYDMASKLTGHIEYDANTGIINSANYYKYDEEDRLDVSQHRTSYLVESASDAYGTVIVQYSYNYNSRNNYEIVDIDFSNISGVLYRINYDYDIFERLIKKEITLNDKSGVYDAVYNNIIKNIINYSYITNGNNTSALIGQYGSSLDINGDTSMENIFNYEYDDKGNITVVRDGRTEEAPIIYSYEYDELGQLIRENNSVLNKTYTYSYDNNGNITSVKTYVYTLGEITGESISEDIYSYGNNDWKDQLTSFNGQSIVYDGMGNPTEYLGNALTWDNIRRLMSYVNDDYTISYTYNDEGIRTSKTVNGVKHEYVLEGSTILFEKYNDVVVIYFYDEAGAPIGMAYRKASEANLELDMEDQFEFYLFTKNLQGDILNIYSEDGTKVASYNYDAWGNHTVTNYTSDNIGNFNPFRYRGYYYDSEINFYYLNSRYYDPEIKRFISADSIDIIRATPNGLTDKNLYAYCDNNPVMRKDNGGAFWHILAGAAIGAVIGFVSEVATQLILEGEVTDWGAVGKSTLAGCITGTIGVLSGGIAISNPVVKLGIETAVGGVCNVITDKITGNDVNVAESFVTGAVTSLIGAGAGKALEKINFRNFNKLNRTQKKNVLTEKVFKCKKSMGNVALHNYYGTSEFNRYIGRGTAALNQTVVSSLDFLRDLVRGWIDASKKISNQIYYR